MAMEGIIFFSFRATELTMIIALERNSNSISTHIPWESQYYNGTGEDLPEWLLKFCQIFAKRKIDFLPKAWDSSRDHIILWITKRIGQFI